MNSIPIDHVGCNVRQTDRMAINYELTTGEKIFARFCMVLVGCEGLFILILSIIRTATD